MRKRLAIDARSPALRQTISAFGVTIADLGAETKGHLVIGRPSGFLSCSDRPLVGGGTDDGRSSARELVRGNISWRATRAACGKVPESMVESARKLHPFRPGRCANLKRADLSRPRGQQFEALLNRKHELGQFNVHVIIHAMLDRILRRGTFADGVHEAANPAADGVDGIRRIHRPLRIEASQQKVLSE